MTYNDVRHIAIREKGDDYYEELRLLESDLDFFNMYIQRNKKSNFSFMLIPCQLSTYVAFRDIYAVYGYYRDRLEETFATYTVLKEIILDVYNETNRFDMSTIKQFVEYMRDELNLDLFNYVQYFVGCSHGVSGTIDKIWSIISE